MTYERPKRIVVIEDDLVMNAIIVGCLKAAGYEVHMTGNADESLPLIVMQKPDLIILDRYLGKVDGTETFIKIRALKGGTEIPVLMLTGETRKEEVKKAINLGINDYLAKPFVPQELLNKVQKLLESQPEHNSNG